MLTEAISNVVRLYSSAISKRNKKISYVGVSSKGKGNVAYDDDFIELIVQTRQGRDTLSALLIKTKRNDLRYGN
ncbi:hypothetical protein M0802_015851 [Mischocyttarus mexicanus]|nr:hypothetical protein M0802_015851 [Mischocyttarus mexicanus]